MAQLPNELAPWSDLLGLFPDNLGHALGGLVRRLSVLFDRMAVVEQAGDFEPEGYSGLHNRGSFERLLPSEWLLAQEIPDEFERRAIMGEQLFFKIRRSTPGGSLRSHVLFDCGPDQLGSPRLTHLALIILLDRRARAAGAELLWGFVQQPDQDWLHEVNEQSVLRMLSSHTCVAPNRDHYAAWEPRLEPAFEANSDVWLIGGKPMETWLPEAGHVSVVDPLDPQRRALEVSIVARGRRTSIVLDLPAEDDSVRLIRSPFTLRSTSTPEGARLADRPEDILFFKNGQKLAVLTDPSNALIYSVPSSSGGDVGGIRRFAAPGRRIVAVMSRSRSRRIEWICVDETGIYFHPSNDGSRCFEMKLSAPARSEDPTGDRFDEALTGIRLLGADGRERILIDDFGCSIRFDAEPPGVGLTLDTPESRCVAWTHDGSRLYVRREGDKLVFLHDATGVSYVKQYYMTRGEGRLEVDAPAGGGRIMIGNAHSSGRALVAIEDNAEKWRILDCGDGCETEIPVPAGADVVGVCWMSLGQVSLHASLIFIDEKRNSMRAISEDRTHVLIDETQTITRAVMDPASGRVAYMRESGELVVYAPDRHQKILRIRRPAAS